MECKIYSDKAMATGTGSTYLLVGANLEEENTIFISPRETKVETLLLPKTICG